MYVCTRAVFRERGLRFKTCVKTKPITYKVKGKVVLVLLLSTTP
jgi:hypothetical protein